MADLKREIEFPNDYDKSKIDPRSKQRSDAIRNWRIARLGGDIRAAMADGVDIASINSVEAKDTAANAQSIAQDTQKRFDAQINGQDKDNEAKDARVSSADGKTYNVLNDRLDAMDKKPQQAVDNLQIGGRNLIISSDLVNGFIDDLGGIASDKVVFTTGIIDTGSNQDMTITKAGEIVIIGEYDTDKKFIKKNRIENPDMYYKFKTGKETKYIRITFGFNKKDYGAPYKVEKGNKATDWSPAPQDSHHHQAFRKGTRFFAHRGAQSIAPENSLPAIRKAGNHAGVEIDIHVTSDGSWVVMHDGTVDRMTNGTGNVSSYTFNDIRKLRIDAGNLQDRYSDSDLIIPTLEEALLICKNQQLIPVIEIKVDSGDHYTSDNWDTLANIITKFGLQDEMMFISFNYQALQEVKRRLPLVEVSYLVGSITTDLITQARALGVNSGLDVAYNNSTVTAANVTACHNAGLKVGVWTTNDDSQRLSLCGKGVDFITTNSLSGEKRYAELALQNNWKRYNPAVDVPHVQETSDGQIAIEFVINGGKNNNGDLIATVPAWATPAYVQWCNGVGRTDDGITPISFNIANDGTVKCGVNWTKGNGSWYACRATYHI